MPPSRTETTENFPVASLLLQRKVRAQVLAFYRLARLADDVADAPGVPATLRYQQLSTVMKTPEAVVFERLCDFPAAQQAMALLLESFRHDITLPPVQSWADLMDLCQNSAVPVGRFLLAAHGQAPLPAVDALCAALQVLNHIQDCGQDWRRLNRIYVPGATPEMVMAPHCGPSLRHVLDRTLEQVTLLLQQAQPVPKLVQNWRLRIQATITLALAERLAVHLRHVDPLQDTGKLPKMHIFRALIDGLHRAVCA